MRLLPEVPEVPEVAVPAVGCVMVVGAAVVGLPAMLNRLLWLLWLRLLLRLPLEVAMVVVVMMMRLVLWRPLGGRGTAAAAAAAAAGTAWADCTHEQVPEARGLTLYGGQVRGQVGRRVRRMSARRVLRVWRVGARLRLVLLLLLLLLLLLCVAIPGCATVAAATTATAGLGRRSLHPEGPGRKDVLRRAEPDAGAAGQGLGPGGAGEPQVVVLAERVRKRHRQALPLGTQNLLGLHLRVPPLGLPHPSHVALGQVQPAVRPAGLHRCVGVGLAALCEPVSDGTEL